MCRWLAYVGEPRLIEEFLYEGRHSLCEKAQHCHKAKLGVHGDGGGLGWFGSAAEPALYRDAGPAWADSNLRELTRAVESRVFFCACACLDRSAESICQLSSVSRRKVAVHAQRPDRRLRQLAAIFARQLSNECFDALVGGTDSELPFQLMLTNGLRRDPDLAIKTTIREIDRLRVGRKITEAFRATLALTNGQSVYAVRWTSDRHAPSLFLNYTGGGTLLVSEPLDEDISKWRAIPANSYMRLELQGNNSISEHAEFFLIQVCLKDE